MQLDASDAPKAPWLIFALVRHVPPDLACLIVPNL
jgi:hypothetical protein